MGNGSANLLVAPEILTGELTELFGQCKQHLIFVVNGFGQKWNKFGSCALFAQSQSNCWQFFDRIQTKLCAWKRNGEKSRKKWQLSEGDFIECQIYASKCLRKEKKKFNMTAQPHTPVTIAWAEKNLFRDHTKCRSEDHSLSKHWKCVNRQSDFAFNLPGYLHFSVRRLIRRLDTTNRRTLYRWQPLFRRFVRFHSTLGVELNNVSTYCGFGCVFFVRRYARVLCVRVCVYVYATDEWCRAANE